MDIKDFDTSYEVAEVYMEILRKKLDIIKGDGRV